MHHIYDTARFPDSQGGAEPNARVAEYPVAAATHRHDPGRGRNASPLCHGQPRHS